MSRPAVWGLVTLIGLIGSAACSDQPEEPTAGTLNVALTTPNSDDGAVLLTVTGGLVDSVESAGFVVYSAQVDPTTIRIIVIGNLAAGTIARIRIADDRQLSRYTAAINQVATRATYAQRDPAGYSLSLEPPDQGARQ
jgi:hypothetical protein